MGFKVKTPGLSVGGETISLSLYDEPQKFLVFKNNNLKLEDQPIDEAEKKDYQKWEEAATFSIISDLYFQVSLMLFWILSVKKYNNLLHCHLPKIGWAVS